MEGKVEWTRNNIINKGLGELIVNFINIAVVARKLLSSTNREDFFSSLHLPERIFNIHLPLVESYVCMNLVNNIQEVECCCWAYLKCKNRCRRKPTTTNAGRLLRLEKHIMNEVGGEGGGLIFNEENS